MSFNSLTILIARWINIKDTEDIEIEVNFT